MVTADKAIAVHLPLKRADTLNHKASAQIQYLTNRFLGRIGRAIARSRGELLAQTKLITQVLRFNLEQLKAFRRQDRITDYQVMRILLRRLKIARLPKPLTSRDKERGLFRCHIRHNVFVVDLRLVNKVSDQQVSCHGKAAIQVSKHLAGQLIKVGDVVLFCHGSLVQ